MLQTAKVNTCCGILVRYVSVLLTALLLVGCASTISARVTSYEQWPGGMQGQTYRVVAGPAQVNNLEFESFSDMVRAAMGPTGLVEAATSQSARFDVFIDYSNPVSQAWVQRYADPYFYNGFSPYFGGYYGGSWGGGVYVMPPVVNMPVEVYKNTLTVLIKDNQNHAAEVYRSSAVSMSSGDNLLEVMPYLARAVFDGFPGNNGQTRTISYELQRR